MNISRMPTFTSSYGTGCKTLIWEKTKSKRRIKVPTQRAARYHIIKDLSSTNGTVLNGEAMVPYKKFIPNAGDTFKIAGVSYAYRLDSFKSSANAS